MNFDEIERLLELMRDHDLAEVEVEHDGLRVRLRKPEAAIAAASTDADPIGPDAVALAIVDAPILGTFYRASGPDAAPFVEVGDVVEPGDVLCIIEAMKQMNEIKSEHAGAVEEIFAENGQPVQYAERLFAIRTTRRA